MNCPRPRLCAPIGSNGVLFFSLHGLRLSSSAVKNPSRDGEGSVRVQKEKCLTYRKHLPGSTYGIATKSHRWWGYFPRQSYIESVLTNLSQIQFWIFILKGLPISPFISYRIVLSSVPYHNDSSVTFLPGKVIALLLLLFFAQPPLWWSITIFPCNRQPPHHTVSTGTTVQDLDIRSYLHKYKPLFFFNIIFCHHLTNNESAHHYHGKNTFTWYLT